MATAVVDRKVTAGGIGGALAIIVVGIIRYTTGIEVDAEMAMAIQAVFVFVLQYLVPNKNIGDTSE